MADGYILSHLAGRVDEALGAILAEDPAESKTSGFVGSETIALLDGINVKYSSIKNVLENVPFVRLSGISDKTTITWDPLHYVPDAGIAQADTVDDLVAHLKGIDTLLASIDITIGEDVVNSTDGSVLFVGTGGILAQDNGGLFYLNGPDYLGVGTNNPLDQIHSAGNISANGVIKIGRNAANHVQLKNVDGVLYVRNQTDAANADLVVNNITITGIVEQLAGDVIELGDQFITLNADYTGATPTADAGLRVERGDLTNASFLWDESSDIWKAGLLGSETRVLVEDASGNWMLGSGTADTKLHVDGRISVGTPSFASTGLIAILGGDNDTIIESLNSDQASAAQLFWRHNGLHVEYGNAAAGDLRVFANNTEVARFLSTGELGLNETLPTARLHITSSANAVVDQIRLHNDDINPTTGTAILFTGHSSDYNRVRLRAIADASALDGNFDIQTSTDGSAFTTGLRVTHDRNVLIGTETNNGSRFRVEKSGGVVADITSLTSGASTLQLTGFSASTTLTTPAGGSNIILRNSDATPGNYSAIQFQDAQGQITSAIYGNYVDHAADEGELVFMVTPNLGSLVEAFRINSDKNATLQGKLTVVGDIEAGTASSFFFDDSLGRVGINRGTSPEASLDVAAFNATTRALRVAGATSQTADIFVVTNSLATADYLKVDASGLVSTEQPVTIRHGASTPGLVLLDADANGSSAHLYIGFARDNQTVEGFGVGLNAVDNSFVISGKANSLTTNKFLIIDGAGAATFSNTATFLGTVTANSTDGTIRIDATRGTGHNWRIQTSGTNAEALEIYDVTNSTRKMLFDNAGTEITGTLDVAGKVTITNSYLQISRSAPYIYLDDSDQVDGNWRLLADGGNFYISQMNDAGAFNQHVITIASDGSTTANTDLYTAGNLWLQDNAIFNNNVELRWKDSVGTERTVLELASDNSVNIGSSAGGGIIFRGNSYANVGSISGAGVWSIPTGEMTLSGANAEFNINSTSGSPYLRFQDGGIDQWYISYDTGGTRLVIGEDTVGSRLTIQDGVGGEIGLLSNTSITGTLATSQPIAVTRSGAAAKLTLARTSSSTSSWTIGSGVTADTLSFINEAGGGGSDAANTRLSLIDTGVSVVGTLTTSGLATFNVTAGENIRVTKSNDAPNIVFGTWAGGTLGYFEAGASGIGVGKIPTTFFDIGGNVSTDGTLKFAGASRHILSSDATGSITISGGSASNLGANLILRGETYVGASDDYFFRASGTTVYAYDHSTTAHSFTGTLTTSGKVGIGVAAGSPDLHIVNASGAYIDLVRTTNRFRIEADNSDMRIGAVDAGNVVFTTGAQATTLTLDSSRNATFAADVIISGDTLTLGGTAEDPQINFNTTNASGFTGLQFQESGAAKWNFMYNHGSDYLYLYNHSLSATAFTILDSSSLVTFTGNVRIGSTATAGTALGLQNNVSVGARNAANTGDIQLIGSNSSNVILIGSAGHAITFGTGTATFGGDVVISDGVTTLNNTANRILEINHATGNAELFFQEGGADRYRVGTTDSGADFRIRDEVTGISILEYDFATLSWTIGPSTTFSNNLNTTGLVTITNGGAYSGPTGETGFRIKFEDVGGTNNDTGIGQHASGSLWFNTGSNGQTRFYGGTDGELLRISSNATLANSTLNWYGGSAVFAGQIDAVGQYRLGGNLAMQLDATGLRLNTEGSTSIRFTNGGSTEWGRFASGGSFLMGTTSTSGNAQIYAVNTRSATSGNDVGHNFRTVQTAATTGLIRGLYGVTVAQQTTGTIAATRAITAYNSGEGTGTITDAVGVYVQIDNSSATSVMTNAYGIYIPAFNAVGTISNRWAIYQSGTSDHNYLAGGLFLNDPTKAGNTRFVVSNQANNYADGMNLHSTHANSARLFFEGAAGANGVYSNNGDLIITGNADPGVSSGSTVAQFTSNGNLYIASGDVRVGTTSATSHAEESFRVVSTAARAANIHRAAASGASYLQFTNDTTGTTNTDGGYVGIDGNSAVRLWNHEAGNILFATSDTERVRVASDAYVLGIGITDPNTWGSTFGAVQMGGGLSLWGRTVDTDGYSGGLTYNATNNGTGWVYHYADEASIYTLGANGVHIWSTAAAGTAGAAITFAEQMRLTNAGNLALGIATPDGKLHVHSASAGTVAAATDADDLVVENNTSGGISILTPDANDAYIRFGSPTDNSGAWITWKYSDLNFKIGSTTVGGNTILTSGNGTTALSIDSNQFATFASQIRVEDGNAIIDRDGSSNLSITTYAGADILFNAGGTLSFSLDAATNDAAFTGNVQIPSGKKLILDNTAHYLWRSNSGAAAVELFATAPIFLTTSGSNDIRFKINTAEVGRIDTSGNFLWGATATSSNANIYATKTYTSTTGTVHAVRVDAQQSVATTGELIAARPFANITHTLGTVAESGGLYASSVHAGAGGTTTLAYGAKFDVRVTNATAVATTAHTIYLLDKVRTGTIGTGWAIYSADTDPSYLTGSLYVGSTTTSDSSLISARTAGTDLMELVSTGQGDVSGLFIKVNEAGDGSLLDNYVTFKSSGTTSGGFTFVRGNTETARMDTAGRLLVGTTSATSHGEELFRVAVPSTGRAINVYANSSNSVYQQFTNSATGLAAGDGLLIGINGNEDAVFVNQEATNMMFYTSNTLALTIGTSQNATFTGNVYIGAYTGSAVPLLVKSSGSTADIVSVEHFGNTVKIASLGQVNNHGSLTLRANSSAIKWQLLSDDSTSYFNSTGSFVLGTTATASNAQFYATKTYSNTTGSDFGAYFLYKQSVATAGNLRAIRAQLNLEHTTGTVASAQGLSTYTQGTGNGGTTTDVYSIYSLVQANTGHTITNAYGLFISAFGGGAGTITNDWGVYSEPSKNYLAGDLRIGTVSKADAAPLTVVQGDAGSSEVISFRRNTGIYGWLSTDGGGASLSATSAGAWDGANSIYVRSSGDYATLNLGGATRHKFTTNAIGVGHSDVEVWQPNYGAIEFYASSVMGGASTDYGLYLNNNAYLDGVGWKYKKTDKAANLWIDDGQFIFRYVASGTADTAITWLESLRIDNTGKVGIGVTSPDGTLHVHTSSAGAVIANAGADDLVVESSGNTGITVLSATTGLGQLFFGDSGNAVAGGLQYNHATDTLSIRTQGIDALTITSAQHATFAGNLTVNGDFSVLGDSVTFTVGNLDVEDKVITIAVGSANGVAADGAGLEVDRGTDTNATILWNNTNLAFDFNYGISAAGTITAPRLRLTATDDAALGSTLHALQIGASNSTNIIIDDNEIMARNNGSASNLHFQNDGGTVSFGGTVYPTTNGTFSLGVPSAYWGDFYSQVIVLGNEMRMPTTGTVSDVTLTYQGDEDTGFNYNSSGTIDYVSNGVVALTLGANATFTGDVTVNKSTANAAISIVAGSTFGATLALNTSANSWDIVSFGTGSAFSGKLAIRDGASVVTTWDEQGNLILGATSTSSNAQFYATKTYSAASGTDYGSHFRYLQSAATTGALRAQQVYVESTHTTGTVAKLIASRPYVSLAGAGGTVTLAVGTSIGGSVVSSAIATELRLLDIEAVTGGGTVTTGYSIYSASTYASYLAGSLRIGTTSATSHGQESFRIQSTAAAAGGLIRMNIDSADGGGAAIQFTNTTTGGSSTQGALVGLVNGSEQAGIWHYNSYGLVFGTNDTERFRVASNAYALGIGTTDVEAWSSSYAAVEFSGAAIMGGGAGSELYHFSNAYYDGSFKYKRTGQASALIQDSNGRFLWSTAASGTLNTTLTWSEKMRLTNAGDLEMTGGGAISTTGTLASGNATVASATPFMRVQDSDSAGTAAVPIFELYDSTSRIGYLGFTSAVTGHMSLVNSVTNGDLNITTTGTGSIILSASGTGAIALQENTTVTGTLAVSYGSGTFPASFTRTGDPMALYAYSDAGGVAIAGNSSASLTGAQYIYLSPSGIIAEVPSGDTHNMSVNGSTVLSVASTGATVTGTLGVTGNVTLSAGSLIIPNGVITLGDESVSSAYFQTQESMYFNIDTNNNESALWHWTHGGTLASGTRVMALTEAGELILGGGTATSSNAQFYATKTYSAASGTDIASYFYYRQSAATTGGLIAVNGVGEAVHTSGTVAELHGLRGLSQANSPGGTVTNVYAGYFWARNISATATITNAYSIYVANKTRSGTITNDWALYSADTAASYLAGSLRIGTTSATSHGGEKLLVSSAGSTNPFVSLVATDSANAYIQFVNSTTGTTASDGLVLGLAADESVVLNNKESTPTRFFTADTERFRVASNAYALGIGTTDLETWSGSYGAIEFGQSAIIGHTTNSELTFASNSYKDAAGWKYKATGVAALQQIVNGSHYWFTAVSGTADATTSWGNSKMTLTNGGALLIGTTGASSYGSELLRVSSSAVHQLNIHGTSSDARLFFSTNSSGSSAADGFQIGIESNSSALLWNRENGYMRFGTNNAERMRIGSNASVLGIGTADLEAWVATGSAIEFGESAIYAQNTGNFISIGSNFYSDGTYRYKDTSSAAMLAILDGAFQFRTAPNGTANNALTWNTMMNLSNTGELTLNGILMGAQSNADVDTGTETVATVAHASYDAVFFDYVIKNGTNTRTGTIYVAHDGTNVSYAETSTVDIGDTTDVTLSVDISGADIRLLATTTSDNWTVKALVRGI